MSSSDETTMKRAFQSLLVLGMIASGLAQIPPKELPLTIAISPVRAEVVSGDDVELRVTVTNHTNRAIPYGANISDRTAVDPNCIFEVTDGHGDPVPKRKYPYPELATGHAILRNLGVDETITDTEPIGRLFDMNNPGEYEIQVSRRSSEDKDAVVVTSNKVTVLVVPKPPPSR